MNPEDNDIVYTQYGPNFSRLLDKIFEAVTGSDASWEGFLEVLSNIWSIWSVIAFIASAIFIYGIIYSYLRLGQLSEIEADALLKKEQAWKDRHSDNQENRRWKEIQSHISSENPNDWKLAIIEADIILGEVLNTAGYAGHSIGEQLKSASTASFTSTQDAWDAHLIRNKIAHEGANFILTKTMAKEAIIKYQRVFKEFDIQ